MQIHNFIIVVHGYIDYLDIRFGLTDCAANALTTRPITDYN